MNNIFKNFFFIFLTIFLINSNVSSEEEKIKIGVLVPMTGANKELGQLIIKSTRMALEDINTNILEIYPKDTASDPNQTLKSAQEFLEMGIDIVVGPIFYKSLIYLD